MNVSLFLKIKSVISFLFGIAMVFFYSLMLPLYGINIDATGALFVQWSGACLIGIGMICWYGSQAQRGELLKGILLALFICDSIGFVASLMAQLSGLFNVLGWSTVALWFVLALGLGYFRFLAKE